MSAVALSDRCCRALHLCLEALLAGALLLHTELVVAEEPAGGLGARHGVLLVQTRQLRLVKPGLRSTEEAGRGRNTGYTYREGEIMPQQRQRSSY